MQLPGLKEGEKAPAGIGETAQFLMDCLRSVQPVGPYRIIGHSLGSHLGFQLVKRLEQEGEEVGFLVTLDSYVKKRCVLDMGDEGLLTQTHIFLQAYQAIGQQWPPWYDRLREELALLPEDDKPAFIVNYIGKHIAANENTTLVTRALSATLAYAAMRSAHDGKIKAPMLVIKADEGAWLEKEDDLGWTNLADVIHLGRVGGTHTNLINDDHSNAIAQKIIDTFLHPIKN
jgi:thioesterase domain-containing protein